MEVVRVDKQPFLAATGSMEARYYDQEFGPLLVCLLFVNI